MFTTVRVYFPKQNLSCHSAPLAFRHSAPLGCASVSGCSECLLKKMNSRVLLTASALLLLAQPLWAQTNRTKCSDAIGAAFKFTLNATSSVAYHLGSLCTGTNYSATNPDGRFSFAFNFGAFSKAPCAPYSTQPPPASFGVVVQYANGDTPPAGLCPLAGGGSSIPCTSFCWVLSGVGAPVAELQSYDAPLSGLNLIFPESISYAYDPFACAGVDPRTGLALNRRVMYNLTCDASVPRIAVDQADEVSLCLFVISMRSKFACGQAVATASVE